MFSFFFLYYLMYLFYVMFGREIFSICYFLIKNLLEEVEK